MWFYILHKIPKFWKQIIDHESMLQNDVNQWIISSLIILSSIALIKYKNQINRFGWTHWPTYSSIINKKKKSRRRSSPERSQPICVFASPLSTSSKNIESISISRNSKYSKGSNLQLFWDLLSLKLSIKSQICTVLFGFRVHSYSSLLQAAHSLYFWVGPTEQLTILTN